MTHTHTHTHTSHHKKTHDRLMFLSGTSMLLQRERKFSAKTDLGVPLDLRVNDSAVAIESAFKQVYCFSCEWRGKYFLRTSMVGWSDDGRREKRYENDGTLTSFSMTHSGVRASGPCCCQKENTSKTHLLPLHTHVQFYLPRAWRIALAKTPVRHLNVRILVIEWWWQCTKCESEKFAKSLCTYSFNFLSSIEIISSHALPAIELNELSFRLQK